jgi:hypothetical protein
MGAGAHVATFRIDRRTRSRVKSWIVTPTRTPELKAAANRPSSTRNPLLLSATILLGFSGLFALLASAQQLDSPNTIQTFPAGETPWGLAFDGTNIWVTNYNLDAVTKLRASDGAFQGIFDAGNAPIKIVFDGANLWIANYYSDTVTKLRATNGAILGTFPVGSFPRSILFDGTDIWIANEFGESVTKLRASDGALLGTFTVPGQPYDLAFDGSNIWVTNIAGSTVTKLRASDGEFQGTFEAGRGPADIVFDGTNIWVTNPGPNGSGRTITKLRSSDGVVLGRLDTGDFIGTGSDITSEGRHVWLASGSSSGGTVMRIAVGRGIIQHIYPVGFAATILFDGTSIWVSNLYSDAVTKISKNP